MDEIHFAPPKKPNGMSRFPQRKIQQWLPIVAFRGARSGFRISIQSMAGKRGWVFGSEDFHQECPFGMWIMGCSSLAQLVGLLASPYLCSSSPDCFLDVVSILFADLECQTF